MKIKRVSSAKYLGLIIDEKLNWDEHVISVCQSLIKYFGIFNQIKYFVTKPIVRQLYFAFIFSRISYGIEVYGSCSLKRISQLQVLQSKLLKLVLCLHRRTPTSNLHKDLHILTVPDIRRVKIICFVNNCLRGSCPDIFHNYFVYRPSIYNFRNTGLNVERTRTTFGSLNLGVYGAKLWNALSDEVKKYRCQINFKTYVIKHIIGLYELEDTEYLI